MEYSEITIPFWYLMTFSHGLFFGAVIPLLFLWKRTINGVQKHHGLELELFKERYEAKITELSHENKRLQDELESCRNSQLLTEQDNKQLKGTVNTLQRHNKDMEQRIKVLNKNLTQNRQIHTKPNDMVKIQIEDEVLITKDKLTALEHKTYDLEYKERSYKTRIAALEATAHKRLMKSSALQRQLMDKRAEVFFLHHRLMEYMDWVAKLKGTRFVPLPLYPHSQKPAHKRVRDSWRPFLTQTRLHVIPEERGDITLKMEPRMVATNPTCSHIYRPRRCP